MSNFYYCNDCKKPTDLTIYMRVDGIEKTNVCMNCGSENVKAIIDTPSGEKEKK